MDRSKLQVIELLMTSLSNVLSDDFLPRQIRVEGGMRIAEGRNVVRHYDRCLEQGRHRLVTHCLVDVRDVAASGFTMFLRV